MDVRVVDQKQAHLDRLELAVRTFAAARVELEAALKAADHARVSRNELARRADPVMSRPTVLRLLGRRVEQGELTRG